MSMQVTSLTMGTGVIAAAQRELAPEKRPPLPIEQKAALRQDAPVAARQEQRPPELMQTAAELERLSLAFNRRLQFVIDQESSQILIKVIDNETDKVVKVLPPEELQRLHSSISETVGFLFDTMV